MFRPRYGYNARTGWRTPTEPVILANPNLLPDNVATGTDTLQNTTGFDAMDATILQSSTEEAHTGQRSLKIAITKGWEGMMTHQLGSPLEADTVCVANFWASFPSDQRIYWAVVANNGSYIGDEGVYEWGNDDWQFFEHIFTLEGGSQKIMIAAPSFYAPFDIYVDDLYLSWK